MKKQVLFLLVLLFGISAFTQVNYEPGYFIDVNGQKKTVLIRNMDWKNSPTSIQYKSDENAETQRLNMEDLKEFGIDNQSKYIKRVVEIDRSSDDEVRKMDNPLQNSRRKKCF